jgi:hypothetical protein
MKKAEFQILTKKSSKLVYDKRFVQIVVIFSVDWAITSPIRNNNRILKIYVKKNDRKVTKLKER